MAVASVQALAQTTAPVILKVGPGQAYTKPSQALAKAIDGAIIEVAAGTYLNDPLCIKLNNITMRAVGGKAKLEVQPIGTASYPPTNAGCSGKGIVVTSGKDITIDGFEFTGARVSSSNGAGIRAGGVNLTVRNSSFHGNEMGILADSVAASTITIEDSEFYDMKGGPSIDQGHNIYIGAIKKLVVRNIVSHHAHVGHLLKTRSRETHILASRFFDGTDGDSSLTLDISGGIAFVTGNYFQKGPKSKNPNNMIHYYTGRDPVGPHELYIKGNSFVSYLPTSGFWVRVQNDASPAPQITGRIEQNTFLAKYFATYGSGGKAYPAHYNVRDVPVTGIANTSIVGVNNMKLFVDQEPTLGTALAALGVTTPISGETLLCGTLSLGTCGTTTPTATTSGISQTTTKVAPITAPAPAAIAAPATVSAPAATSAPAVTTTTTQPASTNRAPRRGLRG